MEKRRQAGGAGRMLLMMLLTALCIWLLWNIAVGSIRRVSQGAVFVYSERMEGTMTESKEVFRMKPPVYFPAMGSPLESEIRRVEFDAMLHVRAEKKERV